MDKTWDALEEDNPIKIVINAKVGRTSKDQVKQLAAMRGLLLILSERSLNLRSNLTLEKVFPNLNMSPPQGVQERD